MLIEERGTDSGVMGKLVADARDVDSDIGMSRCCARNQSLVFLRQKSSLRLSTTGTTSMRDVLLRVGAGVGGGVSIVLALRPVAGVVERWLV